MKKPRDSRGLMRPMAEMNGQQLASLMNRVGTVVKDALPRGPLFAVLVFDLTQEAQYVSNANRVDMVRALREAADRIERHAVNERTPFS